ncbi:F0F1 ATP synthase subunit delta [candidate division WWE3 bacterium]|uniref:F0F1 ATP synthase subunit delta n=1 Tax=candidate division WWE3 bacterium TaxID=2053526 RepID=A0A955LJJ6_UNCKA|nr:F0F1 ATP synthase subunit delta [candidate division WWE3 bacterium]
MDAKVRDLIDQVFTYIEKSGDRKGLDYVSEKLTAARKDTTAVVTHATELSEGQKQSLTEAIKKRFAQASEVEFFLDTSVLGGIKVQFRDYMFDESVKGRFNKLRNYL